jgi:hypothetical protein
MKASRLHCTHDACTCNRSLGGVDACRQQTAGIKVAIIRAAGLSGQDYRAGDIKFKLECDDQVYTTQPVEKVSIPAVHMCGPLH